MRHGFRVTTLVLVSAIIPAFGPRGSQGPSAVRAHAAGPPEATEQVGASVLDRFDFSDRTERFDLPGRLNEVSGIAFGPGGILYAHSDEEGTVHGLDPETGKIISRFSMGDRPLRADFEDIAFVDDRLFLITSAGILYETRVVESGGVATFRRSDTLLGRTCEAEGLDYDPVLQALLIACKTVAPPAKSIVVHRLPLDPNAPRLGPVVVPFDRLLAVGLDASFSASAVVRDHTDGHLVLASARDEALVELLPDGTVVAGVKLSRNRHGQPEGLALGSDGTLYIADEKSGKDGPRITVYASRARPGA